VSRLLGVAGGRTYAGAGVSIASGEDAVRRFAPAAALATRPEVLGGLGGFAGLFALRHDRYRDPVLVASADGVGTKLEVARLAGRFDTVGIDLVAMLVDDLVCTGAEPLFVLDYVAVGALDPARVSAVVASVAEGCRRAGAALLGGETAEHGGVMKPDEIDLAGFAVGVVEREGRLGPERTRVGDVLVGLASPNLRSNGYALARDVLLDGPGALDRPAFDGARVTVADALLEPSVIYAPHVLAVRDALGSRLHAAAHVTGGGIVGNVVRLVPDGAFATIDMESFTTPEIFFEIQRRGPVAPNEMVRVFNCGLGMVLAVAPDAIDAALDAAATSGVDATVVGAVREGARRVEIR
jgi:phosphoribosylformylglycinamidine cyclo-ligase